MTSSSWTGGPGRSSTTPSSPRTACPPAPFKGAVPYTNQNAKLTFTIPVADGARILYQPLHRRRPAAADQVGRRRRSSRAWPTARTPCSCRSTARARPPRSRTSPAAPAEPLHHRLTLAARRTRGTAATRHTADWRGDHHRRPARAHRRHGRRRPGHRRHGAQHRPAAPRHPRRAAAADRRRRRAHRLGRADRRLHAPRRREAVRGARLPPDHRAGQPARLAVGVLLRARRGARRRADARHGGARARGLGAHPAGRAQPGAQPPDVPRLLPARARRHHPDLLRVP